MVLFPYFQPEENAKNDVTPRERRKTETLSRIDEIEVQVTKLSIMNCLSYLTEI